MTYTVLSPWAKSKFLKKEPLSPRLATLSGAVIGLYASFKEYHPFFMQELERQLKQLYPQSEFRHYTYIVDTQEIDQDPVHYPEFRAWLDSVDAVIGVGADMGSCALYMGYIFALIERLGKPACLLSKRQYCSSAQKGASARGISSLRIVTYDGPGFVPEGVDCESWTVDTYREKIAAMLPAMENALTAPLTDSELHPAEKRDWSDFRFTGTLEEINRFFYEKGWTNGTPVVPPTREAVDEMLRGTDLPPDHVVAELPPLNGKATVEKIAINGVMAGCLPTYMPLLIAIVEGMADHDVIKLEGYTCSNAHWSPTIVISGPIRKALGINVGQNFLSPYTKPQSCIARAMAYMIMNISGVRMQLEDMSGPGSHGRFGICIAEDEENSPWEPLQTNFGYKREDSCVTLFWPRQHNKLPIASPSATLGALCRIWDNTFDPGVMITLPPESAALFAQAGYTKADIINYVRQYNTRPSTEIPRAAIGNNHPRKGLIFPAPGLVHQAPFFWNTDHMFLLVAGSDWGMAYEGGGDHGGPVCKKAVLPKNWAALTEQYPGKMPEYVDY